MTPNDTDTYGSRNDGFSRPHAVDSSTARREDPRLAAALERCRAAEERLEEVLQQTETFIGVLAHDLRNPLSAMLTATQVAMTRTAEPNVVKPLQRVLTSGTRIGTMIDQLADFARLRGDNDFPVDRAEVQLDQLCQTVVAEFADRFPQRKVQLKQEGNVSGLWDAEKLTQVFQTLLGNALQHGDPTGEVWIRLEGREGHVEAQVHNMGVIPAEQMAQLFDPFRSTVHGRMGAAGLGLGLFVARELVLAHGGTMLVTSTKELGTTFTLSLPR
jgi:two-component system, sensor histidine kinase and response regulator